MSRLAALLVLGLTLAACGPPADSLTVVQVFLSAREVGDVSSAMSVVAPNATLNAPNRLLYRGSEQIGQWLRSTLNEYSFQLTDAPQAVSPGHVIWRDNLYSQANNRWVGELAWDATVSHDKITDVQGQVVRGASGIICPQCPEGTRI